MTRPLLSTVLLISTCAYSQEGVSILVANRAGAPGHEVAQMRLIVSRMLEPVGLRLDWLPSRSALGAMTGRVVTLELVPGIPPDGLSPDALAFSQPFGGTRIRLFYDRIRQAAPDLQRPAMLAHVMAHELIHVLSGSDFHSGAGLMKARWDTKDLHLLQTQGLWLDEASIAALRAGVGGTVRDAGRRVSNRTAVATITSE